MSTWNIYHKDGTKLQDENGKDIAAHSLEYSDTWMGECFVTITFENEAPIDFAIGDYIEYRGEKFEINYDPGKIKVSSKNSYGAAFKYDSVKFNSLSDELARCEFLDVVLNDNNLHYTALPKFSFYVSSLDDLLDRILANLNEQIGENEWKLFSRNLERSKQRGCTEAEWNEMYGEGTEDNTIESKSITIDQKTCWEALALVNSEWDVNFIVRGRNVYVGTAGLPTANIFKYGKGNGLYEIEQNSESDQSVITRLRAYGSDKNLPSHYYADLGKTYFSEAKVVESGENTSGTYVVAELMGLAWPSVPSTYYSQKSTVSQFDESYKIKIKTDSATITGVVWNSSGTVTRFKAQSTWFNVSAKDIQTVASELETTGKIYFVSGVNGGNLPDSNVATTITGLPNNMACSRLMLPGFPHQTLQEYWDSLTDDEKKYANPGGKEHKFSTNQYRPYVDSLNIEDIGTRQGSAYFDTDDEANGIIEIYPTIEEMTTSTGQRIDEIYKGSEITDDGRFDDGQTVANFTILLRPEIDFDINDLKQSDFTICMKDGMCGGREFNVEASSLDYETGCWKLTLARQKDDALEIYFPYKDYQINAGDHFVLTGIELPESYIKAASLKLLKWAIAYLDENDYTRYVYQPKIDEIFMARQHDEYLADDTKTKKSLYLSLKAGDLLSFADSDLAIDGEVTIDSLSIKEDEGKIPTYEVTLREDKEVGTIKKIQNQISSLASGNGNGTGSGTTVAQTKNLVQSEGSKHFLSKTSNDTAQGHITFEKGLTADGTVKANQGATFGEYVKSTDYDDATQTGWGIVQRKDGKYSLNVTDLSVWGKAVFNNLTIRELSYVGGNLVFSPAASKIFAVKEVYGKNDETEEQELKGWKCYLLADDGTTATTNSWAVDDQARCETFNIKEGVYENVSNKTYWRRITKVSSENEVITDDDGNVLYDGKKFAWVQMSRLDCMENSDIPAAGDTIVLEGNRTDTDRQSFVLKETWGDDAPREIGYTGINSYSLTDKWVYEVGPKRVRFATQYFAVISRSGDKVYTPNYRGTYSSSFTYYYYDEVTWMGTRWLCVVPEGSSTTSEPSENNECWKATTAIIAVKLELEHDLFSGIAKGETHTVTCRLMLGDTDCTKAVSYWGVTRKTDDSTSDAAWATKDKVKNFSGSLDITWSNDGTEDDIGDGDMATFTFTAKTTTGDIYQQVLSI